MLAKSTGPECTVAKGIASGLVAGLAATWVMTQYQNAWTEVSRAIRESRKSQEAHNGPPLIRGGTGHDGDPQGGQGVADSQEPTTVKAAEALVRKLAHRDLTEPEKKIAGPATHMAMGVSMGALYGALAELAPRAAAGRGSLYGAAIWLAADNTALPLLNLAKPPTRYPASTHLYALSSHVVYGMVLDLVRRVVRLTT